VIAGRYTLGREIGRGGAGTVHLARDEVLERTVAIKRIGLLPGADTPDLRRAEREARLAASLNHPNVVAVFDLVEEDGCHWLVMEYVDGSTLAALVRAEGPLPATRTAALLAQIADALVQAHSAGIIHRDIKPSNILIAPGDEAKLGDFGVARGTADVTLTQTGLLTGSPAYLAPEVASGSTADAASDVWSLGATMFHATTGTPPYEIGGNLVGALYKIVHDDPPRLPEGHPLAGPLSVMMVQEPARRWSMEQVRDELRRIAAGQEPTAIVAPSTSPPAVTPEALPAERSATVLPPVVRTARPRQPQDVRRILAAIVAVAAVLLVSWLIFDRASQPDPPTASLTEETDSPAPADGTETPGPDPEEVRAEMDEFIGDYLTTVTSDPEAAFSMLSPDFQEASGGYDGYIGWWNQVKSARLARIESDPENLTVTYTVRYVMNNGRKNTERIELQLVRHDGAYLIDGEG
jgi:serine/threonine protein kinase